MAIVAYSASNPLLRGDCHIIGPQKIENHTVTQTSDDFYIQVYFTIVSRSDGTDKFPLVRVQDIKNAMDAAFNPYGIYFKYDCEPSYLENSGIYDLNIPSQFTACFWEDIEASGQPMKTDGIHIYLEKRNNGTNGTYAIASGIGNNYFYIESDLETDQYDNDNPWVSMIQHQVGHSLGLYHTAHGSHSEHIHNSNHYEGDYGFTDCDGNFISYSNIEAERVDGLNGSDGGDYIPDTRASHHCLELSYDYTPNCGELENYGLYNIPCYDQKDGDYCDLIDSNSQPGCKKIHGPLSTSSYYYLYDDGNGNTILKDDVIHNFMSENMQQECRDHFTQGQADRMRSLLKNHEALSDIQLTEEEAMAYCDCSEAGEIIFNNDYTYTTNQTITKDIIVKSGAELTVESRLQFVRDAALYVERGAKLILNGGTLTADCPDQLWKGVRVQGNTEKEQPDLSGTQVSDDAGMVITNGTPTTQAEISYAKIGIYTHDDRYDWPQYQNYWGGVIYARNTDFVNNDRAVAFMQYGDVSATQKPNKSYFRFCNFYEIGQASNKYKTTGVTIWSTYDIEFKRCIFTDLDDLGIAGIDYGAKIHTGCEFKRISLAVGVSNAAPFQGGLSINSDPDCSIINCKNKFQDNFHDINIEAADRPGVVNIRNNVFQRTLSYTEYISLGVVIEGSTIFDIANNYFSDVFRPFQLKNSGQHINSFRCNTMTYNKNNTSTFFRQIGIYARGLNEEFSFLDNQFSINGTCAPDVRIKAFKPGQHVVAPEQGRKCIDPAGNCFTKNGRLEIETHGPNYPFKYHIPVIDESNICYLPTNNLSDGGVNNYYLGNQNGTVYENECDGSTIKGNGNIELEGNSAATYSESIADSVEYNWDNSKYNKVKEIFKNMGTTFGKRKLYGVHLALGALDSAQIVLNSIPLNTIDDQYFYDVQLLNLQRLQENKWPVYWNLQERELLNSIAQSDEMSAAYAKALLKLGKLATVDGYILKRHELDKINCNNSSNRRNTGNAENGYLLYPNPAADQLAISVEDETMGIEKWKVLSLNGTTLMEGSNIETGQAVDISQLTAGTYMLSLTDESGAITHLKFVKL